MSIATTLRTALMSMGANKLRAGLTLLGIVIGVAAVISLMSIGRGAQQAITDRISALCTNLLFVQPGAASQGNVFLGQGSASTLTLEDANALLDPIFAPSVAAVAPELRSSGQVVAGRNNTFTQVIGVTPSYTSVRNVAVGSGDFIARGHVDNRSEVAVLGASVPERTGRPRRRPVVDTQPRPGEQRLEAAPLPEIACRDRPLVLATLELLRPRQRVVAPFAGNRVRPLQ